MSKSFGPCSQLAFSEGWEFVLVASELGLMGILNLTMLWSFDLRCSQCEAYLTCLALIQGLIPEFIGVMLAVQQTIEQDHAATQAQRKHRVAVFPSAAKARPLIVHHKWKFSRKAYF